MCTRMIPLTYDEAVAALDAREHTGRARVAHRDELDPIYDAYPGSEVPAYVLDGNGCLVTVKLRWGFALEGRRAAVFNTRVEGAFAQIRQGRRGMKLLAIEHGRPSWSHPAPPVECRARYLIVEGSQIGNHELKGMP